MHGQMGTIIAAVDIGSNTVHQVVMRCGSASASMTLLDRRVELIGLGADVAATGAIGVERGARVVEALHAMAAVAAHYDASVRIGIATEGVRAATNADAMLAQFSTAYGVPILLIDGLQEAALSFWGALSELDAVGAEQVAVGDLGGGSCELVTGTREQIAYARSIPLGSNRLYTTIRPSDPPTADDFIRLEACARALLEPLPRPDPAPAHLLAVGGTAAALTRITHGDDARHVLTAADLQRVQQRVMAQPLRLVATASGVPIERLRLLIGGAVAWEAILTWLGVKAMSISHRGVREGAIIAYRQAGDDWLRFTADAVPA